MYRGGTSISKRTEWVIRIAGLAFPLLLLAYGILVKTALVNDTHYVSDAVFFIITGIWTLLAILQFTRPPQSAADEFTRLSAHHLLAGCYILFVSGFATPFLIAWILLIIAAYAYFTNMGILLSVSALIFVGIIDMLLMQKDLSTVFNDSLAVFATLIVGLTVVAISKTQEIDNTELARTKALESLQRDRILTLVNNLADAILSTDRDGVVRVYNAACLNLLDTNSSLNEQPVDAIMKLRTAAGQPFHLQKELKKSRSVVIRDDLVMNISDEELRIELTYSPIRSTYSTNKRSTTNDGYILILRDITKSKSLEEERDEFISVVSHELRTPITVAEGTISNAQLMLERPKTSQQVIKDSLTNAHEQIVFLAKMVNDLSTLSRAERGVADTPEPIDIRKMVGELYNEYAPQAEKKQLHLNLDLAPHLGQVMASQLYLKELLQNFITNALKYTKEGSITIKIHEKNGTLTFDVSDTGIGISKSDQAKIFHKFYRSEDYRTRETGGTGLGLYVAEKLSRKLDTKIHVSSRLNHGSSFSFTLPMMKEK